ncbi:MAG: hypothetical protein LBN07_00380 [Christensenellaceae bacterium]|jgi:hypothetical protein|nr:hypothetical protein [Christensenellaceae bacterium]
MIKIPKELEERMQRVELSPEWMDGVIKDLRGDKSFDEFSDPQLIEKIIYNRERKLGIKTNRPI